MAPACKGRSLFPRRRGWSIFDDGTPITGAFSDSQQAQQQGLQKAFEAVWGAYPDHQTYDSGRPGTSGKSIQQLTGVDVVDTCALRMSYALNQAGFTIGKNDGNAWKGNDGQYYLVRVADVGKFITKTFGIQPQSFGKSDVAGFTKTIGKTGGFVGFSISFPGSTATGHVALFKNDSFRDPGYDDYTKPWPGHYTVRSIEYWRMQ